MKASFIQVFSFIILGLTTMGASCDNGSEDPAPKPDVTYKTNGFLCTVATGATNQLDTLVLLPTLGTEDFRQYAKGNTEDKDELRIVNNSTGTVSIELVIPIKYLDKLFTHLAAHGSTTPPGSTNYYALTQREEPSIDTEFIIERDKDDGRLFSIESKGARGYYLQSILPKSPVDFEESDAIFSTKKQKFFFMPKI